MKAIKDFFRKLFGKIKNFAATNPKQLKIIIAVAAVVVVGAGTGLGVWLGTRDSGNDPKLNSFSNVTFNNLTVDYDGQPHTITITAAVLPEGTSVVYTSNSGTEPGTYQATAALTAEGYNPLTLTATLTINKLNFSSSITFSGNAFDYNGNARTLSLVGIGTLPNGASVVYTGGEDGKNSATNAGVYNIVATVSAPNYNTKTLNATLTINKLNFSSSITFSGNAFDYNGNTRTLSLVGIGTLPNGASVVYTGGEDGKNSAANAGTYNIVATVSAPNYNTKTLNATLTINKINLLDITFSNGNFEYDAKAHSIQIVGNVPNGASVVYTGGENGVNSATNVGSYTVRATVSGQNYNTLVLTATLRIYGVEEPLFSALYNGKLYFQNALDGNRLYAYTNGGGVSKVNNEVATYFTIGGGKLFYFSSYLLSKGIGGFDGSGNSDNLLETNGEYLISDGTYLYFSVNNLIFSTAKNGIYKVSISELYNTSVDPVPTKLTSVKSDYLAYLNGYIYFANADDSGKLYRVSSSANNATPDLVYDYKVTELIADDGILYFTRHKTLAGIGISAEIYRIDLSSAPSLPITDESNRVKRITISNGKYLTKIGDYLYFVNVDLLTSTLFGDGIYRAKADGSGILEDVTDLLSGASKLVDGSTDKLYALSTDGTYLYYYRANSKHIFRYNLSTNAQTDLMLGFTPPTETVILTTFYEKMTGYDGALYYINMRDGGRLYKYDPSTGNEYKLTGLQVTDFDIRDGYLFYATVRLGVNYDLYRMSLITGETERISTDKCIQLAFSGEYIYYMNASGGNTLNRMKFDGSEDTVLYNAKSLDDRKIYVYEGKIYFVASGDLYAFDVAQGSASTVENFKPNEYLISSGKIYLLNSTLTKNSFVVYDIALGKTTEIASLGALPDARSFFVVGNYIYYYAYTTNPLGASSKGLYRVDMTTNAAPTKIDGIAGYNISSATVLDGKVYFLDVWLVQNAVPTTASTGKLCLLDPVTGKITVLN
ncbi:MAG: DUF5050 domain-containing protein [Clostridiales bacterium]|nr:DUF5050 domain-containing protein [Clostridiales bacterium]